MPYLVNIITPIYNSPAIFLKELYQSLQAQTCQDYRWIIINDGSTDINLIEYLKQLERDENRIRLIHHSKNMGLPAARNTGIRNAKAEYIFFIDSDDLIDPLTLEKLLLTLQLNHDLNVVNSYVEGFGAQNYQWKGGFHEGSLFLKENRNTSCFMARHSIFDRVKFDEALTNGCEDWDFWLQLASQGIWGYTIPEFLFRYRRKEINQDWSTLKSKSSLNKVRKKLLIKYNTLSPKNFPKPYKPVVFEKETWQYTDPNSICPTTATSKENTHGKNLLAILPWLEIGGADQFNLNLFEGLKKKDYNITIACTVPSRNEWMEQFQNISQNIFLLSNYTARNKYIAVFNHLIKSRKIDTIYISNSMAGYYNTPLLKALHPEIKIVDYLHCEDPGWHDGGYPKFSSLYKDQIDFTAVTSNQLKQICITNGIPEQRIKTVYININPDQTEATQLTRKRIRSEMGVPDNTPIITFTGRLTEQKQPLVLVRSIAKLAALTNNFKCVIIGDGPDRDKFLHEIKSNNLGQFVKYLGALHNNKVKEYLEASDIFFLPSKYEGIALSIFEAMAKGLVIVGANVGGQSELVTSETGFLLAPSDPETESKGYSSILHRLVLSPTTIKKMGQCGKERIEKFFRIEDMHEEMDVIFRTQTHQPIKQEINPELYQAIINRVINLEQENESMKLKGLQLKKLVLEKIKTKLGIKKQSAPFF